MVGNIRILCYGNGNIKNGEDGMCYDGGLVKLIKLNIGINYEQFLHVICTRLGINPSNHHVEVFHRCPKLSGNQGGIVQYVLVSISDDDDVVTLIDHAQEMGSVNYSELYIVTSNQPVPTPTPPEFGSQHVHVTQETSPVDETFENEPDYDIHVETQVDCALQDPPLEMDQEFGFEDPSNSNIVQAVHSPESSNSPKAPHSPVSPCFPLERNDPLCDSSLQRGDMSFENPVSFFNVRGSSVCGSFEENKRLAPNNWSFNDEFKKGMKFRTKCDLIYAVKMYHIVHHHNFSVDDSDKKAWSVSCSKKDKGCVWKLCACLKKGAGVFVITKVQGPHTCLNLLLSQDHPRLDSTLMAHYFVSHVRDIPDAKVSFLKTTISERFRYKVPKTRVWDAKRKAIKLIYGDQGGPNQSQKRARGRPRSTHMHNGKDIKEPSCKTSCGICEKEGHNRRTCPERNMGVR